MLHELVQQKIHKYRRLKTIEQVYQYTRGTIVQLQFCCNLPITLLTHYVTISRGQQIFQKSRSHLNILGAKRLTKQIYY
jgi:hypothetical protein